MPAIHHVTGITADVQANVDFYVGLLGLRLVKRTVNHNDHNTLHLYYGDGTGAPGTLLTFFAWQAGVGGRRGHGQATEVGLVVPRDAIGYWTARLVEHGVRFAGPMASGGATRLEFADPDGLSVTLVGLPVGANGLPALGEAGERWTPVPGSSVPPAAQVRGIAHVTLWSEHPAETGRVLGDLFGYKHGLADGPTTAYTSAAPYGGTVYVRDVTGFWSSADGAGALQHVAFDVPDGEALTHVAERIAELGLEQSPMREREYYQSRYFREPGGSLIEVATTGPGLTLDEPPEHLGESLVLPQDLEGLRPDIEVVLPAFALPGEPREPRRDLGWVYRFVPGADAAEPADTAPGAAGSAAGDAATGAPAVAPALTLLVLHGSGGSETQLLPMARRAAPGANLLAPRGRSRNEADLRFFARFPDGSFDQDELDHEADALAEFVGEACALHGLDPARVVIFGYSNGAHIGAATLARHPDAYAGAALIRTVAPFDLPPFADLRGKPVLMLQGEDDHLLRGEADTRLATYLHANGAELELMTMPFGHYLGQADDDALREWLERFA